MRVHRFLAPLVIVVAVLTGVAGGQEPAARKAEIQRIRALPLEEKRRLKESLIRFNALPAAEREALRTKARDVGTERLGELAGRDFESLRKRHAGLQREADEVLRLLGGAERFDTFTPDERLFIRSEVIRNFQRHCRIRLLEQAKLLQGFESLSSLERRERDRRAVESAVLRLLDEKTDAERAAFFAMTPAEQRRERAKLMAEWRMRETVTFARKFDNARLVPFLGMTPEERAALIARRVRWFQLTTLAGDDGVDKETLRMLGQLGADERAQVGEVYAESRDLPVADRRAKVKEKIQELYGKGAFDTSRPQRPVPRLPEILRDRAMRERERRREAPK